MLLEDKPAFIHLGRIRVSILYMKVMESYYQDVKVERQVIPKNRMSLGVLADFSLKTGAALHCTGYEMGRMDQVALT